MSADDHTTEGMATLHAGAGFPAQVNRKGDVPNLVDMAAQRARGREYGFSMNRIMAAKALRTLADAVEKGDALPQAMTDATRTTIDDFVIRTLTFDFAVKHDPATGYATILDAVAKDSGATAA